jgi:hypothetical protein
MADKKISALTGATTPLGGTEVLPIVQSSATVKVSVDNLTAGRIQTSNGILQGTAATGYNFTANTPAAGMTSQLLNWYEEGTWTPTYSAASGGAIATTSAGTYTRQGRQVTVRGYVFTQSVSLTGKSGAVSITGLPFSASQDTFASINSFYVAGNFDAPLAFISCGLTNGTAIALQKPYLTTAVQPFVTTDINTVGNANLAYFTVTYFV